MKSRREKRLRGRVATRKGEAKTIFRRHFSLHNKPGDDAPKMPQKLSALSGPRLSDVMTMYASWREFTEDLLVDAYVEESKLKEEYDYDSHVLFLSLDSSKTVKERDSIVATDSEIRKLYLSLKEATLYRELLEGKLESYNNCLTIISREISRRTNAG